MMKSFALVIALLVVSVCALPTQRNDKPYRNHKLLEVIPTTESHLQALQSLMVQLPTIDFWTEGGLNKPSIFRIEPDHFTTVLDILTAAQITPTVLSEDVQEILDRPQPEVKTNVRQFNLVDHTKYHNFTVIEQYLNAFQNKYLDLVTVGTLRYTTYEGNSVPFITLTNGVNRPVVFMECGIHAREWISPAVCLYFIDRLLDGFSKGDVEAANLLQNYEFTIVPVTNPDGYKFTWSGSRLWRKNRMVFTHSGCTNSIGVDLNRNFDSQWNTVGVGACSSDTYPGTSVFSERESQNIREKINSYNGRVSAYISLHSYSQYILTPYAYSNAEKPSNIAHINSVALAASEALRLVHGKRFDVGTAGDLLNYHASGGSADWAQDKVPVPFTVTYELRPGSGDWFIGFQLPASQIEASGQEMWDSLYSMIMNHRE